LKRESYTDASVVAISYLVMLGYITLALAALPPPSQFLHIFVLSRAGESKNVYLARGRGGGGLIGRYWWRHIGTVNTILMQQLSDVKE
jgi:hypothetical protein